MVLIEICLSSVLFSHVEQALNANENQGEYTNPNTSPPGAQGAVELEDGYDRTIDQNPKEGANHIANTAS